jgi:hypothetical protein
MTTFADDSGMQKCKVTDSGYRTPHSQKRGKARHLYLPFLGGSAALDFLVPRNYEGRKN